MKSKGETGEEGEVVLERGGGGSGAGTAGAAAKKSRLKPVLYESVLSLYRDPDSTIEL